MTNFDVVLLHPKIFTSMTEKQKKDVTYPKFLMTPMGFFSLSDLLRKSGFETQIVNLGLEECIDPCVDAEKYIASIDSKIFAIDLHWFSHSHHAITLANICKSLHPQSLVVLGGITATWFRNEILKSYQSIDVVVRGEGERPLVDVAKSFTSGKDLGDTRSITYRRNGCVTETDCGPASSMNELCFTELDLMKNWDKYLETDSIGYDSKRNIPKAFWLPIARGCTYNCIHCGGGKAAYTEFSGREKIALRSPEKIAEDVQTLSGYRVKVINFSHDPQLGGEEYYKKMFALIKEMKLDMSAYVEVFQLPSKEFLNGLDSAFYSPSIAISPESASERVRRQVGKHFDNDDLFNALRLTDEMMIKTSVYFCLGLPGENLEAYSVFENLVNKITFETDATVSPPITYIIDPNCPMASDPEKYDVKLCFRSFEDYRRMSSRIGVPQEASSGYETKDLTSEDINRLNIMARNHVAYVNSVRKMRG
jgi:B12-binding domain/radical SAM domain protein